MYVDTIAAVSSPPGSSARGIVRLSGPRAVEAARSCFAPDDASSWNDAPGHARLEGRLRLGPALELPAAAFLFRAPRSYTREDVVEIHLPGAPGLLALLMDALLAAGVRPAEAGEFTARALHHGALDLTRAEGVAELIHARSDGQLRAARRLLDGALARDADAARDELDDLRALVEAALDFADEDIEFISTDELVERLRSVAARLRNAAASDQRVERLAEPPRIVLAGPPNAGKSTLMNRLTGVDRAICSPLAGTTRDVLCAAIALPHGEAMLCDTAGLFSGDASANRVGIRSDGESDGTSAGTVAHRTDEAARRAIESADLAVWVTALDDPVAPPRDRAWLIVANKRDAVTDAQAASAADWLARQSGEMPRLISALSGEGCDALRAVLDERLHLSTPEGPDVVVLSADLRHALGDAAACIERAIELATSHEAAASSAELIAAELQEASTRLARLTGATDVEELYDRIFSRFCIGK